MRRKYSLALLNFFFPNRCLFCGCDLPYDEPQKLCHPCWDSIRMIPEPLCAVCGVHLPDGGKHCYACRKEKRHFSKVRCFGPFKDPLRALIHEFKYKGKDYLAADLSYFLHQAFRRHSEMSRAEILVPVPLHPAQLRERGYNQSLLLALNLELWAQETPLKVSEALSRARRTPSQTRLSKEARAENVRGAFEVKRSAEITGKNVLLIDDVCTSGATLNECARILRKSGAVEVMGLALARD